MDMKEFRDAFGEEAVARLAAAVSSSGSYIEHIASYRKRPGTDLAHRLVTASGNKLTLDSLLISKEEMKRRHSSLRKQRAERSLAAAKGDLAAAKAAQAETRRKLAVAGKRKPVKAGAAHAADSIAPTAP